MIAVRIGGAGAVVAGAVVVALYVRQSEEGEEERQRTNLRVGTARFVGEVPATATAAGVGVGRLRRHSDDLEVSVLVVVFDQLYVFEENIEFGRGCGLFYACSYCLLRAPSRDRGGGEQSRHLPAS